MGDSCKQILHVSKAEAQPREVIYVSSLVEELGRAKLTQAQEVRLQHGESLVQGVMAWLVWL